MTSDDPMWDEFLEDGVHGRQNPQAAGCNLYPFQFAINEIAISVPNPVTWSIMKSVAMRDRWQRAEDAARDEPYRAFHREQAIKHARDVARVIAMTTREERDHAVEVIEAIRGEACYVDAVTACDQFFRRNDGWGTQVVSRMWNEDDIRIIRDTLTTWLR